MIETKHIKYKYLLLFPLSHLLRQAASIWKWSDLQRCRNEEARDKQKMQIKFQRVRKEKKGDWESKVLGVGVLKIIITADTTLELSMCQVLL